MSANAKQLVLATLLCMLSVAPARAAVLTGLIGALPETVKTFSWGDGTHNLFQQWSVKNSESSGWFYGSAYSSSSNADVYVYVGLSNPTTIANAAAFPYSSHSIWASEGDTVFFRGTNGYYGAWRIDDIYPTDNPPGVYPYAYLRGAWYFQSDGSANFTPEPTTLSLLAAGGLLVTAKRRRHRAWPVPRSAVGCHRPSRPRS